LPIRIGAVVRDYYAQFGPREWERLTSIGEGPIEFAVTCHWIDRYLPRGARVLDVGGGPGRYTLWLAERGHRVVLADLSPDLLALARDKIGESASSERVEEVVEVDARDLSRWPDSSFDAVLSLGPFYHLPEPKDRQLAAAEMRRVLKPRGHAYVALMPRYALLRRTIAIPDERRHLGDASFMQRLMTDGLFINDIDGRFSGGYGATIEEIGPFFARAGFRELRLFSAEGVTSGVGDAMQELAECDPAVYATTLRLVVDTSDVSVHLGDGESRCVRWREDDRTVAGGGTTGALTLRTSSLTRSSAILLHLPAHDLRKLLDVGLHLGHVRLPAVIAGGFEGLHDTVGMNTATAPGRQWTKAVSMARRRSASLVM